MLRVVGKPLPSNIYALITYIESNILEDKAKKKSNPQADKAKVLRETKFIPKIILCIENFNKHVIMLAKKTHDRLANFLHFGTVRDFRIKTSDLKAAIDRTLSHSSQIQSVESGDEDNADNESNEVEDDEETILRELEADSRQAEESTNNEETTENEEDEEEKSATTAKRTRTSRGRSSTPTEPVNNKKKPEPTKESKAAKKSAATKEKEKTQTEKKHDKKNEKKTNNKKPEEEKPQKKSLAKTDKKSKKEAAQAMEIDDDGNNGDTTLITPDDVETLDNESDRNSCTQLLKNLAKINTKTAKKRSLRDSEQQEDPDVLCAPPLEPQAKKSKRTRKSGK